jgi:hypothetical protein
VPSLPSSVMSGLLTHADAVDQNMTHFDHCAAVDILGLICTQFSQSELLGHAVGQT